MFSKAISESYKWRDIRKEGIDRKDLCNDKTWFQNKRWSDKVDVQILRGFRERAKRAIALRKQTILDQTTVWDNDNDRGYRSSEECWFNTFNRVGRFFGDIAVDRRWFQVSSYKVDGT